MLTHILTWALKRWFAELAAVAAPISDADLDALIAAHPIAANPRPVRSVD